MVGSAVVRLLQKEGYENILVADRTSLDLINQQQVMDFFETHTPDYVILAAAKVGGIASNMASPATFLYNNLMIETNVFHAAYLYKVKKLINLGSSCIYPKGIDSLITEDLMMTGPLEETNEGYALSKIAAIMLSKSYKKQYDFNSINLLPCNLYGINDSFDLKHSHVLSALVRRFTDAQIENAKSITLWGTGIAKREFMHVDDVAKAILYFGKTLQTTEPINIGWGKDISIKELAHTIAEKVGFKGEIKWDSSKPNGMLRKCMNVSKMKQAAFEPTITLDQGIDQMIQLYKDTLTEKAL